MRKLISVLAALALVGSLAAQKGKKAAAKAPAKPVVATPAVPAVPAMPAAAKSTGKGGSSFIINAWGGYSINAKTDLYNAVDTFGDSTTTASAGLSFSTKTSDLKNTGIAGGADIWYGDKFQFGVGAYYLQGFKNTKTLTYQSGVSNIVNTTQLNYIPILLQVRFFLVEGLYAGVGAGVAMVNGGKSETTTNIAAGNGLTGVPNSNTYSGTALWAEGRLGYRLGLSDMLGLDLFSIFSYQVSTVSFSDVKSTGSSTASATAADVKNNGLNITPGLAISFKF